jgi:beta-phosphoglucomutase
MLQAVIFDFDGVITDSEILHYRAFNKVLAGYGVEITMKDYYKTYLGLTDADCFKQLIREGLLKGRAAEQELEKLLEGKKEIFEELARTKGKIIEGVDDFLRMLGQNDIPMAICSGALLTEIELILEEARLRDFFEVIVSAEDVRAGKPSPEGFLLTLQKLNDCRGSATKESECVVIEDSHWGLEAAKAAGMHSIAVTNSYDADQLSLAERIVNRLSELSIGDLQQLCM